MSLAILFHFLCTQHVSDINISIIRSLRLCCWITTSVVLFSVRCVLEIWCGWVWVVSVLQASACNTDTDLHCYCDVQRPIWSPYLCWQHACEWHESPICVYLYDQTKQNNNHLFQLWVSSAFCMAGTSNTICAYIHVHSLPTGVNYAD